MACTRPRSRRRQPRAQKRSEIEQRVRSLTSPFRTARAFGIDGHRPAPHRALLCEFAELAAAARGGAPRFGLRPEHQPPQGDNTMTAGNAARLRAAPHWPFAWSLAWMKAAQSAHIAQSQADATAQPPPFASWWGFPPDRSPTPLPAQPTIWARPGPAGDRGQQARGQWRHRRGWKWRAPPWRYTLLVTSSSGFITINPQIYKITYKGRRTSPRGHGAGCTFHPHRQPAWAEKNHIHRAGRGRLLNAARTRSATARPAPATCPSELMQPGAAAPA